MGRLMMRLERTMSGTPDGWGVLVEPLSGEVLGLVQLYSGRVRWLESAVRCRDGRKTA